MIGLDLFLVEFLLVDGTPAIDDVGEGEDNDVVASFVYNKIIQLETPKCLGMMAQI